MSNVHQFPDITKRRCAQLCAMFARGGKSQQSTFAYLSIELEKLACDLRKNGQRSGSMQRAFGGDFSRMTGRFLAREGEVPSLLYRTPDAWIRVIRGFAAELRQDADSLVIQLLTGSPLIAKSVFQPAGNFRWFDALEEMLLPMTEHLTSSVDLVGLFEFIGLNGLHVDGARLVASEWPHGDGSIKPDFLYNPSILSLIPHVSGVNYQPITACILDCAPEEIANTVSELAPSSRHPILNNAAFIEVVEGIRTGIALVMREQSRSIEPALFQWNLAQLNILDENHTRLVALPFDAKLNLPGQFNATPGDWSEASEDNCYKKPDDWLANSVRFHLLDESGFERVASERIVRPWVNSDPGDHDVFWSPAHYADAEECPTRCPYFTTAGAIEGNLKYAELQEGIDGRLDTLLCRDIERIEKLVSEYRAKGEAIERAARQNLLEQWKTNIGGSHEV